MLTFCTYNLPHYDIPFRCMVSTAGRWQNTKYHHCCASSSRVACWIVISSRTMDLLFCFWILCTDMQMSRLQREGKKEMERVPHMVDNELYHHHRGSHMQKQTVVHWPNRVVPFHFTFGGPSTTVHSTAGQQYFLSFIHSMSVGQNRPSSLHHWFFIASAIQVLSNEALVIKFRPWVVKE